VSFYNATIYVVLEFDKCFDHLTHTWLQLKGYSLAPTSYHLDFAII